MTVPLEVYVDGHDRTGNLDPRTLVITRQLNQRQSSAEMILYRQPIGGYFATPSTLTNIKGWWHFDESSGDFADSSGNDNTLTATNPPTYKRPTLAHGWGGYSVRFDGAADYLTSTDSDFAFTGSFTVGAWVKMPRGSTNSPFLTKHGAGATPHEGWSLALDTARVTLTIFTAGAPSGSTLQFGTLFEDDRAHFVVLVYDSSGSGTCYLYADGRLIDTDTTINAGGAVGTSDTLYVGRSRAGGTFWKGRMDELFMVARAMDQGEVEEIHAQGRSGADLIQVDERSVITIYSVPEGYARFAGYAVEVYPIREGAFDVGWRILCVGRENAFESIAVERYRGVNKRTDEIIAEIFAADSRLAGYNATNHVARGTVVDGVYAARDRYLRDILDELAEIDGDAWWVDPVDLSIWKRRANFVKTAAVRFSDDPTEIDQSTIWSYRQFDYQRQFRNPANRVVFRGGTRYKDWNPRIYRGDVMHGNSRFFLLGAHLIVPREGESDIIVNINTGTNASPVWSSNLSVGRFGKDDLLENGGTKQVLHQIIAGEWDKLWFDITVAPPHQTTGFRVYYREAIPTRVKVIDQDAYRRMGNQYFDRVVIDDKITSIAQARAIGRKLLSQQSRPLETIKLVSDIDPDLGATKIEVGDLVHLKNQRHGIDTYDEGIRGYRVQEVKVCLYEGGTVAYSEYVLGTYLMSTLDLLKKLERDSIKMNDFDDDEEETLELFSGWQGTDQDIHDSVAATDSVVITPT